MPYRTGWSHLASNPIVFLCHGVKIGSTSTPISPRLKVYSRPSTRCTNTRLGRTTLPVTITVYQSICRSISISSCQRFTSIQRSSEIHSIATRSVILLSCLVIVTTMGGYPKKAQRSQAQARIQMSPPSLLPCQHATPRSPLIVYVHCTTLPTELLPSLPTASSSTPLRHTCSQTSTCSTAIWPARSPPAMLQSSIPSMAE